MSVRTELEELVKWISALSEKDEPKPTQPLPREDWWLVRGHLKTASERFADARVVLQAEDPQSFVAEFAGDLEREAEALELRAHLLSRRAPPREPKVGPVTGAAAAAKEKAEKEKAEKEKAEKEKTEKEKAEKAKTEPDKQEDKPPSAADLVKTAGDTVETAHKRLEVVEAPDAVAKAFEEELDVLAEMTLSLRQHCERLEVKR